jgi:peptide/nickel transport system permease protein
MGCTGLSRISHGLMMARYSVIKGLRFLLCLGIVMTLQFAIPRLMPGSPVNNVLGPDSLGLSEKEYHEMERAMGLDLPLPTQFKNHLLKVLQGDLGVSFHYRRAVLEVIAQHIGPTLQIVLPSVVVSAALAILLGVCSGRWAGGRMDFILSSLLLLIYAMPAFLTAMVCLALFGLTWELLPLGGLGGGGPERGTVAEWLDVLRHMALPVTVLSLSTAAPKYLVMRNRVVEEDGKDYVIFARAKGLGERRILFVHILRNACLPVINLIALDFGFILSGSLLVEIVFSINGMGSLIHEAGMNRDYPMLQGCFLLLSLVVLGVNSVVDIVSGFLDPRAVA